MVTKDQVLKNIANIHTRQSLDMDTKVMDAMKSVVFIFDADEIQDAIWLMSNYNIQKLRVELDKRFTIPW